MDLSADVSGPIPSDLNTERGLVDWLIVDPHCADPHCADPHCADPASSLPQTRFPLLASARPGMGGSIQPIHSSGQSDNPRAPVGQPSRSNWTTSPVHTDRTDIRNLGRETVRQFRPDAWFGLFTTNPGAPGKAPRKAKAGGIRKSLRLLFKNRKIRLLGFETRAVGRQVLAWCPSCRCGSFPTE
jgi:hypothetical protein